MLPHLYTFLLFLKITYGLCLNSTVKYWDVSFTETLENFLESNEHGISSQCRKHLLLYTQDLKLEENWAMQMFDAGAKGPSSGILEGHLIDLGNFDECLNINHHKNEFQIFGKYCIGTTFINSKEIQTQSDLMSSNPLKIVASADGTVSIHLAKCFPDTCSTVEMQKVYTEIDFELTFSEDLCQTRASQPKLDSGSYAALWAFGVIVAMVIVSTVFDITYYYLKREPIHIILKAFSVFTNCKKLLTSSKSSNEITCLHGIRVISMMWILLTHRYSVQSNFSVGFDHYNWFNDGVSELLKSLMFGVDTFFLLSGFLIVYNYLNAMNNGAKFNIVFYYIHRYLRLTPVLTVMMVFHITLLIHTGSGPLWPSVIQTHLVDSCEINWWKTLLYIQNIFGRGTSMCISPTWYLSADMQLFIVSPFLLLPLRRFPKFALSLIGCLTVFSILACFLIGWFFELNSFFQGNMKFEKLGDYVWYYYMPMHTRASPWLIGLILGYIIFKTKEGNFQFLKNKVLNLVLCVASLTILCTCVFAGHGLIEEYNKPASSIHIALVRPIWAAAVAGVIFACVNGYGGPVNCFLSLPIFQVVSKLTYSIYVAHYTLIFIITAQMRTITTFSPLQTMYKFWGDLACTLVVSVILVLAVEFPVITIDSCLFGRRESTN